MIKESHTHLLVSHAPLCKEIVLVVFFDSCPDAKDKEAKCWVHHEKAIEVLLCLVHHTTIVTGIDHVAPTILCWINVNFRNTHHAHLLEIPVALKPPHPMTTRVSAKPSVSGSD